MTIMMPGQRGLKRRSSKSTAKLPKPNNAGQLLSQAGQV